MTIALRVPGIARPLVGNFATKNVVYAMIARNWALGRADLWHPTLDCLVGGRRSLHMVEFPVSAYLTGGAWRLFGGPLDIWGRATSVVFSAAAVAVLFALVRRRHGLSAAVGAGAVMALSPVGIIYGQSFMLEASLVFFTVAAFDAMDRWLIRGRTGWLAVAAAALALLWLTKIYMVVLLLPLGGMVFWPPEKSAAGRWRRVAVAGLATVLAIVPAGLWYTYAYRAAGPQSPLAGHVFYSVRQSAEAHRPPHPLLGSPDFYARALDDLSSVVLTPIGLVLVVAGLLHPAWRRYVPWLAAMAVLVVLLPRKFHEMNYYWMAVLPPLAIVAGLGWEVVHRRVKPGRGAVAGLVLVGLLFSLRYTAGPAWATPEEDRAVVRAGQAVQKVTGPEEPVVTVHGTTIDLLYYADRPGWAVAQDDPALAQRLAECHRQGARHVVAAGREACEALDAQPDLRPLQQGEGYCIATFSSLPRSVRGP